MKLIFLTGLLLVTVVGLAQTPAFKTTKYAGTYSVGDVEKGDRSRAVIYPETDNTILFFIDICRGAGSSSIAQLYGRVAINNGQGIYTSKKNGDKKGCKWKVLFDKDILTIKTLDGCYECSLGQGIHADNQYKRKMNIVPGYFTDAEGRKVYFDKTSPENYLK